MSRLDDRIARSLLQQMARQIVPLPSADEETDALQRSAARVERLVSELHKERLAKRVRARRLVIAAAAAFPAVLVAGGFAWFETGRTSSVSARVEILRGSAHVVEAGSGRIEALSAGQSVQPGTTLSTAAGAGLVLKLVDEARVNFTASTSVRLAEYTARDERLELTRGSVSFEVPKLPKGHTLSVHTPDAVVTVRGTRFSVSLRGVEGSSSTIVAVSEGRVQVDSNRGTVFLGPGQTWASAVPQQNAEAAGAPPTKPGAPPASAGPEIAPAPARAVPAVPDRIPRGKEGGAPRATPARGPSETSHASRAAGEGATEADGAKVSSTLGDENLLYERALRRAQGGETSAALADLESLIRRHPSSPLIQNARVEHFRILVRSGQRSLAASEARRYLSDYPDGFARAEAKNVALLSGTGD
jgi:hypothetical protein